MNEFSEHHQQAIVKLTQDRIRHIYGQREEILTAFIAKYGYEPDRLVQCEERTSNGMTRWYVRRFTDEEMAEMSHRSACL